MQGARLFLSVYSHTHDSSCDDFSPLMGLACTTNALPVDTCGGIPW